MEEISEILQTMARSSLATASAAEESSQNNNQLKISLANLLPAEASSLVVMGHGPWVMTKLPPEDFGEAFKLLISPSLCAHIGSHLWRTMMRCFFRSSFWRCLLSSAGDKVFAEAHAPGLSSSLQSCYWCPDS